MLGDVASFLFSRLVSSEESAKSVSAEKVRDDLLKDAHIASSPLVKTNKRIPITTANGGTIHHEFHLGLETDRRSSLLTLCLSRITQEQ